MCYCLFRPHLFSFVKKDSDEKDMIKPPRLMFLLNDNFSFDVLWLLEVYNRVL